MATLPKAVAKRVDAHEDDEFEALPAGVYVASLLEVDATKEGPKGPYWSWQFKVEDEEYEGRRLFNNTSLSEKADFKMKETFDAFGVPSSTDTDELIGHVVKLAVSQQTIQGGSRDGQLGNQVDKLLKYDSADDGDEDF